MPYMGRFYKKEEDQIRKIVREEMSDFMNETVEHYHELGLQQSMHGVALEKLEEKLDGVSDDTNLAHDRIDMLDKENHKMSIPANAIDWKKLRTHYLGTALKRENKLTHSKCC